MSQIEGLPDDLLLTIFSICDVETLMKISLTCRRFYSCIDRECFWKQKLQALYGDYELPTKVKPKAGYKSACLRYCAVFNELIPQTWTDCPRCQDAFCSVSCIQERDEVIIFDFGSKTTWFKYASDSTGQLSMHPTVAPFEQANVNPLSQCGDDMRDIYQCCPVCSRMFHNKVASLPETKTVVLPKAVRSHGSRRLTSAFSKLALKHFSACFDSADMNEEESMALSNQFEVVSATQNPSNMNNTECMGSSVNVTDQSSPKPNIRLDRELCGTALKINAKTEEDSQLLVLHEEESGATAMDKLSPKSTDEVPVPVTSTDEAQTETYKFLVMHMLKRNPCFQAKCIPFVLCEPTDCTESMKIKLMQFLFTELKVPGVCYIPKPVATALYSGLDTCLVIDSGANNTIVSAVVDQSLLGHLTQRKNIGGTFLSKRLLECIRLKGVEFEIDEANIDSSQVKRECYLAYNIESENRKTRNPKTVHVKGYRNDHLEYQPVSLGAELYLASEDLYLNMDLPMMVATTIHSLDGATCKKLLSNIVLTGGNCRLNGLSLRLAKDVQQIIPEHSASVRVVDPRLMTGRTDAVIGASYIRKWYEAFWVSRHDYIYHGANRCMEKALSKQVHCV